MEIIFENIIVYSVVFLLIAIIFFVYLRVSAKKSRVTSEKIEKAKEFGIYEPISLHPVVDTETCIGTGACVAACPEKDILGMANGQAHTINASRCVGHGACFHACPVEAITLCIGTEKRGVDLPHISQEFETNIPGLFIAGELGGMGLIKNAVAQGKQAVENFSKKKNTSSKVQYDIIIVGAGPAGISATLTSEKSGLKYLTIEQDSLGGTVYNFPRAKIVMTSPMYLPLYGKVKLFETTKKQLLDLWNELLSKNNIKINEFEKVENIEKVNDYFIIKTNKASYTSAGVLLAIGRRGTPRKLNVPGEEKEKVAYRLIEPELIQKQNVLVVGGGDSAIESAILLAEEYNNVTLSYRGESFSRVKPKNLEKITSASKLKKVKVLFNTNVKEIKDETVLLTENSNSNILEIENDLVYILAGGELPTAFLEHTGITITKKFGDTILKHGK
ncbi:MAG: 4Fe-4S ferredoxin [Ignavibacteriales bacterium CG_4_9_14_3_um_filter_30_11]|nr:MAG: 4Fe-4S ferredoxin [Ignavibacteriales bacterium CG_4_9_14_3_um_filter_30_11]